MRGLGAARARRPIGKGLRRPEATALRCLDEVRRLAPKIDPFLLESVALRTRSTVIDPFLIRYAMDEVDSLNLDVVSPVVEANLADEIELACVLERLEVLS